MSLNAAALKMMADRGLTAHEIAEIAAANEVRPSSAAIRQKRYRDNKRDVTRDVTPPPNERDNLTPTRETKTEAKASSKSFVVEEKRQAIASCLRVAFILPNDIPSDPWASFEEMRKRIRKPMTDNARSLAVAELRRLRDEEGWPPGDVLNHCTMNSYQGIYPPSRKRNVSGIGKSAAAFAALNPSADEPF